MFNNIFPDHNDRLVYDKAKPDAPKGGEVAGASTPPAPKPKPDPQDRGRTAIERAIEKQIRGMTVADKIEEYLNGIANLLFPSHESVTSVTSSTKKPENTRRTLDRLLAPDVSGVLEGFYEQYLAKSADKKKELPGIAPEEHIHALLALNRIPFDEVLKWYERYLPSGKSLHGRPVTFPDGMDYKELGRRVIPNGSTDRMGRAHEILWQTVNHFLRHARGREALKNKWIEPLKSRYKPKTVAEKAHYEIFVKTLQLKPNEVTWQFVMHAEIDPAEVAPKK